MIAPPGSGADADADAFSVASLMALALMASSSSTSWLRLSTFAPCCCCADETGVPTLPPRPPAGARPCPRPFARPRLPRPALKPEPREGISRLVRGELCWLGALSNGGQSGFRPARAAARGKIFSTSFFLEPFCFTRRARTHTTRTHPRAQAFLPRDACISHGGRRSSQRFESDPARMDFDCAMRRSNRVCLFDDVSFTFCGPDHTDGPQWLAFWQLNGSKAQQAGATAFGARPLAATR